MGRPHSVSRRLLLVQFLVSLCFSSVLHAADANQQSVLLGERASGMGGAFVAMTGDPTSSYYNPAGLASLTKRGLSLSASAYQFSQETYPGAFDLRSRGLPVQADLESSYFTTFPASVVYVFPVSKPGDTNEHVLSASFLVPNHGRMEARLNTIDESYPLEVRARLFRESITYWAGPSYGFGTGNLRIGLSLFGLAQVSTSRITLGQRFNVDTTNPNLVEKTETREEETVAITSLIQLGLQYRLTSALTAGITFRSNTLGTHYQSGSILWFNNGHNSRGLSNTGSYVDRLETSDISITYRRPWTLGVGFAYEKAHWAISLDSQFTGELPSHTVTQGEPIMPTDAEGNPVTTPSRTLDPNQVFAARMTFNAALGFEYHFGPTWLTRLGIFSDRSGIDLEQIKSIGVAHPYMYPALDHYGLSVALGHRGDLSSTSVGVVTTVGKGEVWRVSRDNDGDRSLADASAFSVTLVLAGSTNL